MNPLIWIAVFGFPVWAWFSMPWAARREMVRWFWLMLAVGAVAGTAWSYVHEQRLSFPAAYDQSV